ncbi:hypothetical protein QBC37DRAFT_206937 [Rhypophila decipiens]|uniref:Uncharacterized protein n=1 Tax=Rhypophila decipiens TaxID=261697 RepID=A0AAN7B5K8_9PEZI|nr:hypothetical protein QBC37DRAFT_206937 [Rhypophila decipiens]
MGWYWECINAAYTNDSIPWCDGICFSSFFDISIGNMTFLHGSDVPVVSMLVCGLALAISLDSHLLAWVSERHVRYTYLLGVPNHRETTSPFILYSGIVGYLFLFFSFLFLSLLTVHDRRQASLGSSPHQHCLSG